MGDGTIGRATAARLWADQLERDLARSPAGDVMVWMPKSAVADVAKVLREVAAEQDAKNRVPWCGRCQCYHYYGNCV